MILKSINAWSFPGGLEGTLAPEDAIAKAVKYGFEDVELTIAGDGPLGLNADEARCAAIRGAAEKAGLPLLSVASGVYWGRSLGSPDAAEREGALEDLRKLVKIAGWLGAKTLLTIPGAVDVFFAPDRAGNRQERLGPQPSRDLH
ncbi:sugar phosphate isomerase/epimerase, partial [bacterium]